MKKILYQIVVMTLFLMSFNTICIGQELSINGYPVKEFSTIKDSKTWSYNYKQKFNKKSSTAWRQLGLNKRGWKQHSKYSHVSGYNGDISLKIITPGPITKLRVQAMLANYADRKVRKAKIAYSTNGIDFKTIVEKEFGIATLTGSTVLTNNQGVLWLRFSRVLEKNDHIGKHSYIVFKSISFELTGNINSKKNKIKVSQKYDLKNFFPTGVFWPWERTKPNADLAKKELWKFVEDTMKVLSENNCNTIWFVNIGPGPTARKICFLAEKYKLKVLLNTNLLKYYYHAFDSFDNIENTARKTINSIGDCPALIAYILKDEPRLSNLAHSSYFYKLMKRLDPRKRDSIVVVMNRQTSAFLEDSAMPVICSDIYYFGHDKSTNIPSPASHSQYMFRRNVSGMNKIAAQRNKHSWLMPQMYSEIWGRHYREGNKMVVEPGSYLHWRMPTKAETRWQIWEAMRCGSKGVIFFVLYPSIPLWTPPGQIKPGSKEAKQLARMDKAAKTAASWKRQKLTEKRIKIDPGQAMMEPGGKPTPQMLAAGIEFKYLRKYATLLNSRQKADFPVFFPNDADTRTATFIVPDKPFLRYGVIVNDNLNKSRKFKVLLPINISTVKDLNNDSILSLKKVNSNFQSCEIQLAAGAGCLLEASFIKDQPGMLLLEEDFSQFKNHKVKVNSNNAKVECFGAFGINPFYRVKMTTNKDKPVVTIAKLTNRKRSANTVFMNINNSKRQGTVFCLLDGHLKSLTIKGIADSKATTKKTNIAHLAKQDTKNLVRKSTIDNVIKTDKFYIPAVIPVGTTSLEFFLDKKDYISNIVIWFVPDASEQKLSISGTVKDTSNNDLPGVSVTLSGKKLKTITNSGGIFSFTGKIQLQEKSKALKLVFRKSGYHSKTMLLRKSMASISVKLKPTIDNTEFIEHTELISMSHAIDRLRRDNKEYQKQKPDENVFQKMVQKFGYAKEKVKLVFRVRLPSRTKIAKGIFLISEHGMGGKMMENKKIWGFADKYHFALIGFKGRPMQCGIYPASALDKIISKIAVKLKHPELSKAPLFTFGHSNGTGFSALYPALRPDRTIGWISYHSGTSGQLMYPGIEDVPGLVMHGLKDKYLRGQEKAVKKLRLTRNAPISMMMETNVAHWPRNFNSTFEFIIAFCESCIRTRLSDRNITSVNIKSGWLGDQYNIAKGGIQKLRVAPYSKYNGDKNIANWFPDETFARIWTYYGITGKIPKDKKTKK